MTRAEPTLESLLKAPDHRKRGADHHKAKLTPVAAATIREALARGVPQSTIARAYGVTRQSIAAIKNGKTWR